MHKKFFEIVQKSSIIKGKNLYFFKSCTVYFKKPRICAWSQNWGLMCKLQYYNEHFGIKTVTIGTGVEPGQHPKRRILRF